MKDFYKILDVSDKSSASEIKKSFRKLAVKYHPDKNPGNKSAEKRMVELNEAYAILGNQKLKGKYDQRRVADSSRSSRSSIRNGSAFKSKYEHQRKSDQYEDYQFESFEEFLHRSFEDIFDNTFGDLFGFDRSSNDLESTIYLRSYEALHGCRKQFSFQRADLCKSCFGNSANSLFIECTTCKSLGKVLVERTLWITIPSHTPHLSRLKIRYEGSNIEGNQPGDLYLIIHVNATGTAPDDPNMDYHVSVSIILEKAYRGGPLIVNGAKGPIRITIPAGIYPGKIIRVRDEGLVDPVSLRSGHLYITFGIDFPEDPTRTQQEQMEELMSKAS